MENNKNNNYDNLNNEKVLDYKVQDPFFIDYYKYRNACITAKALILKDKREPIIVALYEFIDHTVDYIRKYDDKVKEVEDLLEVHSDIELKDFRDRINQLWKDISSDHVLFEILPKPNYNSEQDELEGYWRNEKSKSIRELKKVMVDTFKNQN